MGGEFRIKKTSPLIPVLLATFTSGFAFGIVLPVASVILEGRGVATPLIGLAATVMFVGWAIGAPFAGRMIELYGIRRTLIAGISTTGLCMIAHGFMVSLPVWLLLRFLIGSASASMFTACETLINRISTDNNRGKNLGLYALSFSASLIVGPVGLWLLRYGHWLPFVSAGLFCCGVAAGIYHFIPEFREPAPAHSVAIAFARRISVSLIAMLMAGFMEGALISLIPLYALRRGFAEAQAGILLLAFMLGHGGLPLLIGVLADRIGPRQGLLLSYGLGSVSFLLLVFLPAHLWIAAVLICGGAAVGALYPLAVGLLASALAPAELPRGNALTMFCYGIGSIAGPFVPSLIMHLTVPESLFAVVALLYGIVFLGTGWPRQTGDRPANH